MGPILIFGPLMVILALRASVLNHHFGPQVTAYIDSSVSQWACSALLGPGYEQESIPVIDVSHNWAVSSAWTPERCLPQRGWVRPTSLLTWDCAVGMSITAGSFHQLQLPCNILFVNMFESSLILPFMLRLSFFPLEW